MLGAAAPGAAEAPAPGFDPVYDLLTEHCGACHVRGQADGPWSLDTAPTSARFPECLTEASAQQLRCATYHQLVDAPGPGVPAWIRPADGGASEPYAQACDPAVSFHLGHSLPSALPAADCDLLLRWIEGGARRHPAAGP
ncbi:MAG TPA: hypothetical protein VIS76_07250 [Pseudomonadales bacterium]